jgi:hypothetical protein
VRAALHELAEAGERAEVELVAREPAKAAG